MKKRLSLILALVMLVSLFAGCTKSSNNAGIDLATKEELDPAKIGYYSTLKLPIDDNNTEISVLVVSSDETLNDSLAVKELRKRTGLNIQLMIVPSASVNQKVNVLIASGDDLPDMMKALDEKTTNKYADQGAFECVSDHLDELPNLKEIFYTDYEKHGLTKDTIKNFMNADGKLYMMPRYDVQRDVNHGFLYRKDIFDKHGIKMWTDKDSFLNVLRELKKLYPNSTPFASKTGTNIFRDMGYQWNLVKFLQYYDENSKEWKMSSISSEYKEMLDMIKTMYNEGLIDPEFITCTEAVWTQRMAQPDKAFVTWDWISRTDMFEEQTLETNPEYDLRYAPPLNNKVITLPKANAGPVFKKGKNSLLAMKLADYLISPSGAQLMTMGIEDTTYTLNEKGFADYIGFEKGQAVTIGDLELKYGLWIDRLVMRNDRRSTYYNFTEREQEAQDMMNNMPGGGYWAVDPVLSFTKEENDVLSRYQSSYAKAAEEFSTNYVLKNYGDKEWAEWLKEAKKLGAEEILKVYNDAQKRYDAM